MNNCIFCSIISGAIPAHKVYEDEHVLAFLDLHPINPGHVLVIPKVHEPDVYKLDDTYYHAVMNAVKSISNIVKEKLQPARVGTMTMGWDVPHAHVHVVPMNDRGDITSKKLLDGTAGNPSAEELSNMAKLFSH